MEPLSRSCEVAGGPTGRRLLLTRGGGWARVAEKREVPAFARRLQVSLETLGGSRDPVAV